MNVDEARRIVLADKWPTTTGDAATILADEVDRLRGELLKANADTERLEAETLTFLSDAELRAMDITVELVGVVCQEVIGRGPTREADVREFVAHVHAIQQAILSQGAGRAYPDRFRRLGETLR